MEAINQPADEVIENEDSESLAEAIQWWEQEIQKPGQSDLRSVKPANPAESEGQYDWNKMKLLTDALERWKEEVERPMSHFEWFASTTTFHGFHRLIESQTRRRRAVWGTAILIAFCVVVAIISERTHKYFLYETVTETKTEFEEELEFPAITICNHNMIRESALLANPELAASMWSGAQNQPKIKGSVAEARTANRTGNMTIHFTNSSDSGTFNRTRNVTVETVLTTPKTDPLSSDAVPEMLAGEEPFESALGEMGSGPCATAACTMQQILCETVIGGCCLPWSSFCNGEIECKDESDEPITLCNLGSSFTPGPGSGLPLPPGNSGDGEGGGGVVSSGNPTPTTEPPAPDEMKLYEHLKVLGWQLEDSKPFDVLETTLVDCRYNKVACNSSWFKQTVTKMGSCYTFNHEDIKGSMSNSGAETLVQKLSGPMFGLTLFLNIQQYDYTSSNNYVGAKVLVHPKQETPDMTQEGINIPAGLTADIRFTRTEVYNHKSPWGKCDKNRKLKSSTNPYTFKACAEECRLSHVLQTCQCRPYFIVNSELMACGSEKWYNCVEPEFEKVDTNFESYCDCPVSCYEVSYDPKVSYMSLSDNENTVEALFKKYYNITDDYTDDEYFQRNFVGVRLYFGSMMKTVITEHKALDELGVLSEIGGHLGLFVGVSILTLLEVIDAITLACLRRKRREKVHPKPDPVKTIT